VTVAQILIQYPINPWGAEMSRTLKIGFVFIAAVAATLCFTNETRSNERPYSTKEVVALNGTVHIEQFFDANDKPEKASILHLDTPIDVLEGEFGGPASQVSTIQLVYLSASKFDRNINYDGKHVKVTGTLFYGITAHHHTQVLVTIKTIALAKPS